MKKFLLFIMLLSGTAVVVAQPPVTAEMKIVGEPKEEPSELVGKEIRDDNGEVCAGFIINTDLKGLVFQANNGVVKINQVPGRYFLFLSPGENVVDVFADGFAPLKIVMNNLGIRLRSGQSWSVKLTGEKSIPVNFIITPQNVKLFVNGVPTNYSTPPQMKIGKHAVRLEKEGWVTINDTIEVSESRTLFPFYLREKDIYDPGPNQQDESIIKATVANFTASDDLSAYELNQLTQAFRRALEATGKYKIVPLTVNELAAIINQYESGTTDEQSRTLIAGIPRKTNEIFKGSIGKLGDEWTVLIQKIDVRNRQMDNNAATIRYEGTQSGLVDEIDIAAQKIAGTYVDNSLWYYLGGAAVLGGGAAVFLLQPEVIVPPPVDNSLPLPPSKPN